MSVKNQIQIKKLITIEQPSNTFIKQIVLDGNWAEVYFKKSESTSHYLLSDDERKKLIEIGRQGKGLGGFYNGYLKGKSVYRSVPRQEFEEVPA